MKLFKSVLLSAVLLGAVAPGISQARGGHGGHGGHFGFGWGLGIGALIAAPFVAATYYRPAYAPTAYAPYAYAPAYAPAPVVYAQPTYAQPAYAQPNYAPPPATAQPLQAQQAVQPWYFCAAGNGYYPYVRQCPGGWQQVSPTPPDL